MKANIDYPALEEHTETLRAIAHPLRMAIISQLFEKRQMNVTEIFETLDIEQAVASHHLRILKDRNVVNALRDGKNIFYALAHDDYYRIVEILMNRPS